VGEGVRAVDWCEGWIPISRSARGRDYLCIDLDPAPGGVRGQIVEYVADDSARPLVAKSFADLLSLYFEQAQTGAIDLDEDEVLAWTSALGGSASLAVELLAPRSCQSGCRSDAVEISVGLALGSLAALLGSIALASVGSLRRDVAESMLRLDARGASLLF
jgi:hypothetical protein